MVSRVLVTSDMWLAGDWGVRQSTKTSQGRCRSTWTVFASSDDIVDMIRAKNQENPVIVYSKTYCPYCMEVKSLLSAMKVQAKIVELDTIADGTAVQDGLYEVSGMRTVPQVFVGGKLVGGCDDTLAAHKDGSLAAMLEAAGTGA